MWLIPNEDTYWENARVYMEDVYRSENVQEEKNLFVDEELDDLEREYGCKLEELPEGDLLDIVQEIPGEMPIEARYNPDTYGIEYTIESEVY